MYRNIQPPPHAYGVYISEFIHYLRGRVSLKTKGEIVVFFHQVNLHLIPWRGICQILNIYG
jgi:hypothetical protein